MQETTMSDDDNTTGGLYRLNDAQHATVLAALRFYQQDGLRDRATRFPLIEDIASNSGQVKPLRSTQIDALCKSLNHNGLTFADTVPQFAESAADSPYVAAARAHHLLSEGMLEVDDPAVVSQGDDSGAYVMAWLWIDDAAAGVTSEAEREGACTPSA
jgi:hypothetical protein